MQPISTMRSPPAGDSPVVSVSKTISRMSPLNTCRKAETSQDIAHLGAGFVQRAGCVDQEIGAGALFLVRKLAGQYLAELVVGHPRPAEHPLALQIWAGR